MLSDFLFFSWIKFFSVKFFLLLLIERDTSIILDIVVIPLIETVEWVQNIFLIFIFHNTVFRP